MEQPKVDPSGWASRRMHAMNRAKEIRSKLKDPGYTEPLSVERPLQSKADLQRQRRSRQLEETQRLLDRHAINCEALPSKSENVNNDSTSWTKSREETGGKNVRRASQTTTVESHSIISREQLGHIYSQYNDHGTFYESTKKRTITRDDSHGLPMRDEKTTEEASSDDLLWASEFPIPTPESAKISYVGERPRGRGRGRNATSGNDASKLGELALSSRSISHTHQASSWSHRTSQPKYADNVIKGLSSKHFMTFLRERQVPGYKEGECEKLAVLRRKLVSRRNDSSKATKGYNAENIPVEGTKSTNRDGPIPPYSSGSYNEMVESFHGRSTSNTARCSYLNSTYDQQFDHQSVSTHLTLEDNRSVLSSGRMDQSKYSQFSISQGSDHEKINHEEPIVEIELVQCECCKRSFAPKVYEKHIDEDGQPKCANHLSKKRPIYNSAKARIANNDNLNRDEQVQAIQMHSRVQKELAKTRKKGQTSKNKKSCKWREESNAFREAMKSNRLISKAEKEGKPAHYYL